MKLQERIDLLVRLGKYMLSDDDQWKIAKEKAGWENSWFLPEFIELACRNIAHDLLEKDRLAPWAESYSLPTENPAPKKVGIVMAGNIPLVGFHDLLCVFITGNRAMTKLSSRDQALVRHLVSILQYWNPEVEELISFSDMLKGCDAYIATGSNNSAGYFDYYFGKYPHIIRKNRTSVSVLTGHETNEELDRLADDVYLYFGLGCRNVTKIWVPEAYDFVPLLNAFRKYHYLIELSKYKNNYDYNLSLLLLNNRTYMSNDSILLVEERSPFSPIGQLNYEYFRQRESLLGHLKQQTDLQCIVGKGFIPFGQAQHPSLTDYADGVDTMRFLASL
jgi:hypothetical protein